MAIYKTAGNGTSAWCATVNSYRPSGNYPVPRRGLFALGARDYCIFMCAETVLSAFDAPDTHNAVAL